MIYKYIGNTIFMLSIYLLIQCVMNIINTYYTGICEFGWILCNNNIGNCKLWVKRELMSWRNKDRTRNNNRSVAYEWDKKTGEYRAWRNLQMIVWDWDLSTVEQLGAGNWVVFIIVWPPAGCSASFCKIMVQITFWDLVHLI